MACEETEAKSLNGVRTSSPLDLFIELAGVLSLVDLVVVGDAMVRLKLFSVTQLQKFCAGKRWHSRRARRGAQYVRAEVDSPMESRLRMLLVLAGLPEPKVNHKIVDNQGRVLRRFDLSYPSVRTIVDYDGRQHAEDPEQWASDIDRREEIDDHDWRLVVVTSRGIFQVPEQTVMRVARVLRKRGLRVGPLRDDWRVHFQGR